MTRDEAIAKLRQARVGRLASIRPDGTPHVVPFVFALVEDGGDVRVYWAVDEKPKKQRTIQRLENIGANPVVEFVVDEYDDDWTELWWVRVRGHARSVTNEAERRTALAALSERYEAYRSAPPHGPFVVIEVTAIHGWTP